jgi:hypothetical protein
MDQSTENVTLLTAFILDVVREVEKVEADLSGFKAIIQDVNLQNPYQHVPIQIYNDLCAWVETQLGLEALHNVGYNVGETVFNALVENGIIAPGSSPEETINGLVIAAGSMINDPKNRGWELLATTNTSVLMRRTQTFNSSLQLGLLKGLIEKSGKQEVQVTYQKSIANGDEFDEYLVVWKN